MEVHRNPAIEAAIAEDPDAIEPHLVYADWLTERGDPRGELIAVQHRLGHVADLDALAALRDHAADLAKRHAPHLLGPLHDLDDVATGELELGFVRVLDVFAEHDVVPRLCAALAVDHPATRFLTAIHAPHQVRARLRAGLDAAGRAQVALIDQVDLIRFPNALVGTVRVQEVDGDLGVMFGLIGGLPDASQIERASLVATTLDTGAGRHTWWCGCSSAITRRGEDRPSSGQRELAGWDGEARLQVSIRLRLSSPGRSRTVWLGGETGLGTVLRRSGIVLHQIAPVAGPPFEIARPPAWACASGPVLVDALEPIGAVLPDVGVVVGARQLITEDGARSLPDLSPPPGMILQELVGGAAGALCAVHRAEPEQVGRLIFVRCPDIATTTVEVRGRHLGGGFDPTGRRYAAVLDTGVLAAFDVDTGGLLGSVPLDGIYRNAEIPQTIRVDWHGGSPFVYQPGSIDTLDLASGVRVTTAATRSVSNGWYQGRGDLARHHPGLGRTAWASVVDRDGDGLTRIGWNDAGGGHGDVAVPDRVPLDIDGHARLAILDDGRLVVVGLRIWLVDPARNDVDDLGDAGAYPDRLPITCDGGRSRLWSRGPGPWWVELP